MRNARWIALLFIIGCASVSFAQNKIADSLRLVLRTHTQHDTVRVNLLNKLAARIYSTEADNALLLYSESETLASQLQYARGRANSLAGSANIVFDKGNYSLSIQYYQKALGLYEALDDKKGLSVCYHNFGMSYYYLGDFDKAAANYKRAILYAEEANALRRQSISLVGIGTLYSKQAHYDQGIESFKKALVIDGKLGNKKGISNALVNLGTIYKRQAKYPAALENFHQSLEIKEQIGDVRGMAAVLSNLGGIYEVLERDAEALSYYNRAYGIHEKLTDKDGMANTLVNIGLLEMKRNQLPSSRNYLKKALELSEALNNQSKIADCLANMATLESRAHQDDLALRYLERAATINTKIGSQRELSYCFLKMGQIFYRKADYDAALLYAGKSAALADQLKITDFQKDIAFLRSEIYYAQQQYKLAYDSREAHQALSDSIFSVKNIDEAAQIKYKYAYKQREGSLQKQVKTKDSELESSQQQKMWWIIGSVCLLAVFGFAMALVKIRKVKMENKQLLTEQKLRRSQMNPHFIFNSIQNIRSLLYNKKEDEAVNYLNKFSKLTRQILESSDENYTSLADELKLIENYIAIQQLLYTRAFDFTITVDEALDAESIFLPPMLTQPFIENAIKHGLGQTPENGRLDIRFYLKGGKLFFEVTDNGSGFVAGNLPEAAHKSMAITITRKRLAEFTKNSDFEIRAENLTDPFKNIVGAKVSFEIPYIYEN